MFELISAVGGGAAITGIVMWLARPQTFMTILTALTAPFPGSRLYQRYMDILSVVNGVQPTTPANEEKPALPKGRKKGRNK